MMFLTWNRICWRMPLRAAGNGNRRQQGARLAAGVGLAGKSTGLRLLESYINTLDDLAEELRLLEWLVLVLNPDDNQGLRESLARLLSRRLSKSA